MVGPTVQSRLRTTEFLSSLLEQLITFRTFSWHWSKEEEGKKTISYQIYSLKQTSKDRFLKMFFMAVNYYSQNFLMTTVKTWSTKELISLLSCQFLIGLGIALLPTVFQLKRILNLLNGLLNNFNTVCYCAQSWQLILCLLKTLQSPVYDSKG